jgi:hypothetical protein
MGLAQRRPNPGGEGVEPFRTVEGDDSDPGVVDVDAYFGGHNGDLDSSGCRARLVAPHCDDVFTAGKVGRRHGRQ